MNKNSLNRKDIFFLLLLLAGAILSWCLLKISSIFVMAALLLVGLKIAHVYESRKISLLIVCIASISLSLWLALFFGMFFITTAFNSIVGDAFALFFKKIFGWFSYIVLFVPIIYVAWRSYKKAKKKDIKQSNQNIENDKPIKPNVVEVETIKNSMQSGTGMSINPTLAHSQQYKFPPLSLLEDYQIETEDISEEIESRKQLIEQTLGDFGISVTDITATIGATVTLYELVLARGVSANKIKSIDEDIARNLKVSAVRIISPFKNRGTVALEVPNNKSCIVKLKSILKTVEFQNCNYELPLALGKTIDNKPQIVDLTEMPHILVAGATGQGKSVGLNAMLTSLLYKKRPEEVKFVLIDPKLVELSIYEEIKTRFHVAVPEIRNFVITDNSEEISITLQSLCNEMKRRIALLTKSKCRNIKEFNESKKVGGLNYLPYIVIVIDEFADIDLKRNKIIKDSIILLARQARAAGIHLIVATQRPSTSAIDGDITANFPARIAFKVIKSVNSQIILGESGAEKLVGKGDMLFSNNSEMERLQGAFVSTDEVKRVVDFIEKQR